MKKLVWAKCVKCTIMNGMYKRYKNTNLEKIQRSNERLAQDKSLSKGKMIHNGPQICCNPQGSLVLSTM